MARTVTITPATQTVVIIPPNVSVSPPVTQGTPTPDPTTTALQKVILQNQANNWGLINFAPLLSSCLTGLSGPAIFLTAIFGLYKWFEELKIDRTKRDQDHQIDREKRDEERFQSLVQGLGSERIEARVGAAILLRTFLQPGYEKFYAQAFDLAVAYLRLRKVDPDTPEPLDSLSQALIIVLKESYPKARDHILSKSSPFVPDTLDATKVQLDNAYLSRIDLREIHLRGAFLRKAYFWETRLDGAYLKRSNLEGAFLVRANLEKADLARTVLKDANFTEANLQEVHLRDSDLSNADFTNANLTGTRPQGAASLQGTILRGVKGLTREQLALCAAKGAIIDDVNSP